MQTTLLILLLVPSIMALDCYMNSDAEYPTGYQWFVGTRLIQSVTYSCNVGENHSCFSGDREVEYSPSCSGESLFCASHECGSSQSCYCVLNRDSCAPRSLTGMAVNLIPITCEDPAPPVQLLRGGRVGDLPCDLYFSGNCIKVTCAVENLYSVTWLLQSYNNATNFTGTFLNWCLPEDLESISGTLVVTVFSSTQSVMETFSKVGVSYCEIHDCVLCWSVFSSWICLPLFVRRLVLTIVIIICILLGAWAYQTILFCFIYTIRLMLMLLGFIWIVFKCPVKCFKSKFCMRLKRWARSAGAKVKLEVSMDDTETQVEDLPKPQETAPFAPRVEDVKERIYIDPVSGKKKLKPQRLTSAFLVLMMPFLALAMPSCSQVPVLSSSLTSCSRNQNIETCTGTIQGQLTFPFSYSAACFNVLKDGVSYGEIRFYLWGITDDIVGTRQYYTSSWSLAYQSAFKCYSVGQCSDAPCSEISSMNVRDAMGEIIDPNVYNRPGFTSCRRSCGGWACGCFLSRDGCVFSGYGLVPRYEPVIVILPTSRSRTFHLGYSYAPAGVVPGRSANFSMTMNQFVSPEISLTLTSNLDLNINFLEGKCLLYNSSHTFVSTIATKGVPSPRIPGDIQATSASNLVSPSPNSFLFSQTSVHSIELSQETQFSAEIAGMDNMNALVKLPVNYDGYAWSRTGDILRGDSYDSGSLTMAVELQPEWSFQRVVDMVCPEATFSSASGCFSCAAGFTILISAASTCSPGTVTLDSPTLQILTQQINLMTSSTSFIINAKSSHQNLNDILNLRGTGSNSSVTITGILTEIIDLHNDTSGDVTHEEDQSWWDSWKTDFKSGNMSWDEWLFTIALFVIGTVLVITLVYAIWKCYKSRSNKPKST